MGFVSAAHIRCCCCCCCTTYHTHHHHHHHHRNLIFKILPASIYGPAWSVLNEVYWREDGPASGNPTALRCNESTQRPGGGENADGSFPLCLSAAGLSELIASFYTASTSSLPRLFTSYGSDKCSASVSQEHDGFKHVCSRGAADTTAFMSGGKTNILTALFLKKKTLPLIAFYYLLFVSCLPFF